MKNQDAPPDPASIRPQPIPVGTGESSFFQLIPQLFIFPLVLVTIGVLVYALFIASAKDTRSVSQLLEEVQTGWFQTKNRAAFELAMRTHDLEREGKKFTREETRQIVSILKKNPDNPNLRRWLIHALGRAGDEELSLPELLAVLDSGSQSDLDTKIYAIDGLALSRSPTAVPALLRQIEAFQGGDEWEPRQHVLAALTNIAVSPRADSELKAQVVTVLREHLEDPYWSVRWNAAAMLASDFGDASGVGLLRQLLDRDFLREHWQQLPKNARKEDPSPWIVRAIVALAEIEDEESYAVIESLRKDPSNQVRRAVFSFREKLSQKREKT